MTPVEIPPLHAATWPGIYLGAFDFQGLRIYFVQSVPPSRKRRRTWRRWIAEESTAVALAAETAERLEVPLFDLREPGGSDG